MAKHKQQPPSPNEPEEFVPREIPLDEIMRLIHERTGQAVAYDGHDIYTLDTSDYPRHLCADGTWRSLRPGTRCPDCEE